MKTIKEYQVTAEGEYKAEGAATLRIFTLGYKAMKGSDGKPKAKPDNCTIALPLLEIPTTGNADCDAVLEAAITGFQDDLCRKLRADAGNPAEMMLSPESVALPAVLAYAAERGASLKLTEAGIAQWFESEGKLAIQAQWYAAKGFTAETATPEQAKQVASITANSGVVFAKLAAPVPDVNADIAKVMLHKLSVLDAADSSAMTNAVRRKLQQRIDAAEEAKKLTAMLGIE